MNPHYNVVAAVLENEGKFFCVRRGKTKYPYTSEKYEFPGGKIEPGETEEEALQREIHEELELDISIKYLLMRTSYDYPDFSVSLAFFLCTIKGGGKPVLLEHNNAVWMEPEEMKKLDWVAADKIIVEEWKSLDVDSNNRSIVCLNCGRTFNSLFCPDCGQRRGIRRFDWLEVARSITRGFFNADRGIFYTAKEMFTRPGRLIMNYLKGKRIKCFPPFPMMFIFAAAYGVIKGLRDAIYATPGEAMQHAKEAISQIPTEDKAQLDSLTQVAKENHLNIDFLGKTIEANGDNFGESILDNFPLLKFAYETLQDKFGLVLLLAMPFFVVALRRCFGKEFRKSINWPETYIFMAFYYAQCFLYYTALAFITLFTKQGEWTNRWMVVGSLAILVWYMIDFVPHMGMPKKIWRSILTYFYFGFLILIAILILAAIVVLIFTSIEGK